MSSSSSGGCTGGTTTTFACLFTKHKTQKRKKWQDGRWVMIVHASGSCCCRLYAAHPMPGSGDPLLDQCELSTVEANAVRSGQQQTEVDTGSYLVTIEGPWTETRTTPTTSENNALFTHTPIRSQGMHKLLQSRFRKPERKGPLPAQPQYQQQHTILATRKRPLQPGELYTNHHHYRCGAGRDALSSTPHGGPNKYALKPTRNTFDNTPPEYLTQASQFRKSPTLWFPLRRNSKHEFSFSHVDISVVAPFVDEEEQASEETTD